MIVDLILMIMEIQKILGLSSQIQLDICCDYTCDELKKIKEKSTQTKESVKENRKKIFGNFEKLTGGDYSHENMIKVNRKYNV